MIRGLGCMRLSTVASRDDGRAHAALLAAIDHGVTLLDTADAYALDDADRGHNERLVAAACAARPTAAVRIVTKGGLVRPGGRWQPDGRATHLAAAAAASRGRLPRIDLYLLHAIDPQVPLATSARALARLRADGVVGAVGLANVGRAQLEAALAIAPIAAIEIELSPRKTDALRGGLVAWCSARGVEVLAHRPFGGAAAAAKLFAHGVVAATAARLGASPAAVVLAWLRAHGAVPLPGATQVATAIDAATALALDDEAQAVLDRAFLDRAPPATVAVPAAAAEVVVVMGVPGAGKSTAVAPLVEAGYARLNRDERGGTLAKLARALDDALAAGATRVVLDNTYPTRAQRADVIAAAGRHGASVRLVWLDTSLEDAQVNAAARAYARLGRQPEPAELIRGRAPVLLPPAALFRWRRELEPPGDDEGFVAIERRGFTRQPGPGGAPALIVELADVVWRGRPERPDDVALIDGAAAAIDRWRAAGWAVVATGWAPAVAEGRIAADALDGLAARAAALLGAALPIAWCRHGAGPPVCWCRKPLPSLGVELAHRHGVDLARAVHVGAGAADRGFAERLGLRYVDAATWWRDPAPPPPG
ncbi:MAG: aldo/keto reductase [Myxococcales bacterium]|nr:aldo/keto reductase [Myxococcales bacterium]MBK7194643.1 aldo/keto reductase [Myxococcales bacterium]MBP6842253.1 aldo/keto reductase [Kofleriaceae bacterium]